MRILFLVLALLVAVPSVGIALFSADANLPTEEQAQQYETMLAELEGFGVDTDDDESMLGALMERYEAGQRIAWGGLALALLTLVAFGGSVAKKMSATAMKGKMHTI